MPTLAGPGALPRWIAAVGLAALVFTGGISLCLAEEATSPRAVYLASLGDQPTALGVPRRGRDLVSIASRHIGKRAADLGLPRRLWCADFVNRVRREAGLKPVPSRLARDQVRLGRQLASPRIGAIAVISRRGGRLAGHTGIIRGFDEHHVVLISGNSIGRRVAEETISRARLIAIVDPSS